MTAETPEQLFRKTLHARGYRVTPDRLRVFRHLLARPQPVAVAELADALQAEGTHPVTVYRVIDCLSALGVVHPVLLGSAVGFELSAPFRAHHHHLWCRGCGRLFDLAECELDPVIRRIEEVHHLKVEGHELTLEGLCDRCAARSEA
ncbi:MAG: transcriptional repressor [Firmicutes bacterium]|nr:transcriptional repressor [Alicyclobacillaceae bacterium]MCL6497262.1 transcriptional repressor [Bacillota bacterium]